MSLLNLSFHFLNKKNVSNVFEWCYMLLSTVFEQELKIIVS